MSVWVTIPSARPVAEVAKWAAAWRERGYEIALWRDDLPETIPARVADWVLSALEYPGYARAVNVLVQQICAEYPGAEWFVAGGDDVFPDPNHTAEEIAAQLRAHFAGLACIQHRSCGCETCRERTCTFGVMQPTGDRFAGGSIDRICGSPWMGREFCKRINQGHGPLWPEYTHMWVDEELQHVAIKYGVFWQRPDLIHLHRHFQRESDALDSPALPVDGVKIKRPHFLEEANSNAHWTKYKGIFLNRQQRGVPGSEPL